jgi:hypothetical protein
LTFGSSTSCSTIPSHTPPWHVTPIPIPILCHLINAANTNPNATESRKAVANLIIIAYYFLMRPGEY